MSRATAIVDAILEEVDPEEIDVAAEQERVRSHIEMIDKAIEDAVAEFKLEADINDGFDSEEQAMEVVDRIVSDYAAKYEIEDENDYGALKDAVKDEARSWYKTDDDYFDYEDDDR